MTIHNLIIFFPMAMLFRVCSKSLQAKYFIELWYKPFLDAKFNQKTILIAKNISLIKSLGFSGSYYVFNDSLKFSQISVRFNLPLFKSFINISYTGVLDPYEEVDNVRINKFYWEDRKFPLRHDQSSLNITVNNKSFDDIIKMFKKEEQTKKDNKPNSKSNDKLLDILKDFKLNYNVGFRWEYKDNRDTTYLSYHSISVKGSIPLTKNWTINIGNFDYNLKDKKFEYPDLGFTRNLHCWQMTFSWIPNGGSYTFFIGVKSSMLEFIKYNHGQDSIRGSLNSSSYY
ncbi:MAG: putative LPS assembly protein LptD [Saprospiraceae bacterium]